MDSTGVVTSTEQCSVLRAGQGTPHSRRFQISDAMLLTGAVALGLATTRLMSQIPPYLHNPWVYAEVTACWIAIFLGLAIPLFFLRAPPPVLGNTDPAARVRREPRTRRLAALPGRPLRRHADLAGSELQIGRLV
jgi:hypothetical protein